MKSAFAVCVCVLLAAGFCNAGEPGGDPFGGGGFGGGPGNRGGGGGGMNFGNFSIAAASRMLGIDLESFKREANVEQLPLAEARRLFAKVPVGGVDNYNLNSSGWKMEGVFKMNAEQVKSVEALRDEYKIAQRKLSQEIYEEQLKQAKKAAELRLKYELKANELLAGADKESKEKLDALSLEVQSKSNELVKDTVSLFDLTDANQGFNFVQSLREKISALYQNGEDRMIGLVPAENRAKIQELIKKGGEGQNPFMGGRGNRGGGPGGGPGAGPGAAPGAVAPAPRAGGNDAVKPPKPPNEQF